MKRRDRRAQRRNGTGLTTSDESEPDSAFPARTPEQQNIKVGKVQSDNIHIAFTIVQF